MNKQTLLRRMRKSKMFLIGGLLFLLLVIMCITLPFASPHDPIKNDLSQRLAPPDWFSDGMNGYILGADALGRDVLTRILVGGRYSLFIAMCTLIPSAFLGIVLGLVAGYFGGIVETVIMRFCDIMMAIPGTLLAICIVSVLGASMTNLIITLAVSSWVFGCRVIRGEVLAMRKSEFVQAARVMGAGNVRIIFTEVLPNVVTPAIITEAQHFAAIILSEAGLGFLGMGIQPPTPTWGVMLSESRQYITEAPWLVIAPGVALMLTVLACNFLGSGIRDILDPKNKD